MQIKRKRYHHKVKLSQPYDTVAAPWLDDVKGKGGKASNHLPTVQEAREEAFANLKLKIGEAAFARFMVHYNARKGN